MCVKIKVAKIPLNLPFTKGDFAYSPLEKGGRGEFKRKAFQHGLNDIRLTLMLPWVDLKLS